ncbi:MAG: hypothetical protein Q8R35_01335 [bacterium]|nr:hypothetical protein [bacterium]
MSRLEEIQEGLYRREPVRPPDAPPDTVPRREERAAIPSAWEDASRPVPRLLDRVYLMRIGERRPSTRTIVTLCLLALVGLAAFIGYTVFFARSDVELEILGPDRIVAGEPTVIIVHIPNRGSVALVDGALTLNLPPGAILAGSEDVPFDVRRERVTVDEIPPGGVFQREFRIQFLAGSGAVMHITGLYLYRPENIPSKLTRQGEFSAVVTRVPVAITIGAPEKANAGQELEIIISVDAETSIPLPEMSLDIEFPGGFALKSADPMPPPETPNLWSIGRLASGTSTRIVLRGILTGEPEETKLFHVRLGRYDAAAKSWLLLTETTAGPAIASPFLLAQATIDGNRRGALVPGASVEGRILFRNNLAEPLQNVAVTLSFPEQFVELETIRVDEGFYDVTRRMLIWNPASSARLSLLDPGGEGMLSFSFTLKANPPVRTFSDKNFRFPITTTIDTGTPPPDFRGVPLLYRDSAEFQIASRLTLAARAAYYDSPTPSAGPLPPQVREATTYTVFLQLGSGVNDVRDVSVRALLPGGVEFKNTIGSDIGSVEFNPASRELVWRIGQLPAGTGTLRPHAAAMLQLALTPAENQVNSSPPLLVSIAASGRDSFTGTELVIRTDDVTTELRTDVRSNPREWQVVP